MRFNKLSSAVYLSLVLCSSNSIAQKSHSLNTTQNSGTSYDYQARDYVVLEPGFSMAPISGVNLQARINEKINTENGNISSNPSSILDRYNLNTSYEVGSTAGKASVAAGGQSVYAIPIFTSPGTGGMAPNISLQYVSQQEAGVAGYGWDITGLSSISRANPTYYYNGQTDDIKFTNVDAFVMDGQRLFPLNGGGNGANGTIYGTENESFTQIISHGSSGNGPAWFEVKLKSGITMEYGNTNDSKLENGSTAFVWKVNKITDANGNYILLKYLKESNESVIDQILYTGNVNQGLQPYNSIEFYYDRKAEASIKYVAGKAINNSFLLRKINSINEGNIVRSYELTYQYELYTKLIEVVESAGTLRYNSTLIRWEGLIANVMPSSVLNNNYMPALAKGDANGDGVGDLVVYDVLNSKIKLIVSSGLSTTEHDICFYSNTNVTPPSAVMLNYDQDNPDDEIYIRVLSGSLFSFQRYIFTESSGVVPVSGSNDITTWSFSNSPVGSDITIIPAELNGDDKLEYIFLKTNSNRSSYIQQVLSNNGVNFNNLLPTGFKTYNANQRLSFLDFNGNGKTDILKINNSATNPNELIEYESSNNFVHKWLGNIIAFENNDMWGDFNGDGNSDLYLHKASLNRLDIYISNGNYSLIHQSGLTDAINTKAISSSFYNTTYSINDFNSDGKSDILYHSSTSNSNKLEFFYSNGKDYNLTTSVTQSNLFEVKKWLFADLNGDGICDAYGTLSANGQINQAIHNIFRINYNASFTGGNVVTQISDGIDFTTFFQYSKLSEGRFIPAFISNPYIHMGGIYGLANIPQIVVKKLRTGNSAGTAFYGSTEYFFLSPIYHRGGKGLLGFLRVVRYQKFGSTHIHTEAEDFALNTTYHALYPTQSVSYINESYLSPLYPTNHINRKTFSFAFESLGGKRFWLKPVSETTNDVLNNLTQTTTYNTFDIYGNPTKITTVKGMQTTVVENSYVQRGAFCPNKVSSTTTTMTRTGQTSISRTVNYTYDNTTGNLLTTVNDPGKTKSVTTTLTYNGNNCGLPNSKTISASGLSNRTESYEFDDKLRFVTKLFNTLGQASTKTFDTKNGNTLTETGVDGLTTQHFYNSFGRQVKSIDPLKVETNYSIAWNPSSPNSNNLYYTYTNTGGIHGNTLWYDILGRLIKKNYLDANNNLLTVTYAFYPDGRPKSETKPYFNNQTPTDASVVTYDAYGRLIKSMSLGRETSISYNSTNRSTTKITKDAGGNALTTSISVTDNSGMLQSSTDNTGTVNYNYNSVGQLQTTEVLGVTTSISYDEYGNKVSLTDPSSGITDYDFNAFGELIEERNAKGVTKMIYYDIAGRIREIDEFPGNKTTNYTFITSGNGINQISSIVTDHGINQSFIYDKYGRNTSVTELIDGQTFVTQFEYNALNQLLSTTYPSGYKVDHTYNANGYVATSSSNNQLIWSIGTFNEMGLPLSQNLRNGLSFQYTYDSYYQPQYRSIHNASNVLVRRQETSFNPYTGNLTYRKDVTRNLTESFNYDAMERLTSANAGTPLLLTYESNGNIQSKSDVSNQNYQYANTPYAVTDIPNPLLSIPSLLQNITYNNNDRATQISEGTYSLSLYYGHDNERRKTALNQNNQTIQTRYYTGNYEKEVTPTSVKEFHYLYGVDGLVAVMIRQNGQDNLYYTFTDHLGSILGLMDVNGNLVEEYSFDAWGRRRNPTDWSYNNLNTPTYINRGFTGHEHLDQFGLINMNARLYDPIVGRMLGPDAFVQAPDNTQSFNRYSYVWNNPLKYTDPDGNFIFSAIAALTGQWWALPYTIGMDLGMWQGGSIANGTANPLEWKNNSRTWGYMLGGAVIGGISGGMASTIASSGSIGANTLAIITGSFANSVGTSIYTGGQTDVSISFGVASLNMNTGEWGYLGKKGNSISENIGYGLGLFANISDAYAAVMNATDQAILHSRNHSKILDKAGKELYNPGVSNASYDEINKLPTWRKAFTKKDLVTDYQINLPSSFDELVSRQQPIYGINLDRLKAFKNLSEMKGNFLLANPSIFGAKNCAGWSSLALLKSGVFNIPIAIPFVLSTQMYARQYSYMSYYLSR